MFLRRMRNCSRRSSRCGVAIATISVISCFFALRQLTDSTAFEETALHGTMIRYFDKRGVNGNGSLINDSLEEVAKENHTVNQSKETPTDEHSNTWNGEPDSPPEGKETGPGKARRGQRTGDKDATEDSARLQRKAKLLNRPDLVADVGDADCVKVLPHCIIVGVMKAGTEAFTTFLSLNPRVAMQLKSETVLFFNANYDKGLEWYRQQMSCSRPDQVTIEKSPQYFGNQEVPGRIQAMNSSIKLLMVVREPVARAVSHYSHVKEKKPDQVKDSFEETVLDSDGNVDLHNFIVRRSMYNIHLKTWLAHFPLKQIHVVNGDKMVTDPQKELEKVETFLGLNHSITQDMFTYNSEKGFYCLTVGKNANKGCLGKGKGRKHPDVDPAVLQKLKDFFRDTNEEFYSLVEQSFDWNNS